MAKVDDIDTTTFDSEPLFLTTKINVNNLSSDVNVYDFQLRDHFLNTKNLYGLQCKCIAHKHNKERCTIIDEPFCVKCKTPAKLIIDYKTLMFHRDILDKKLATCCPHQHSPPCKRCLNCQINLPCIVPGPFECIMSTG